jgi:hypothetical protein
LGQQTKYNRLFDEMRELVLVLKARTGDARAELLPLLNHRNAQVRIKAAIATLVVAPEKARTALQLIVDRGEFPQAADASGTLSYLEDGRFVPD